MAVARDGDGNISSCSDRGPDEAWDALGPVREDLDGQGYGVDVGTVVGNDRQCEDDHAEFAEGAGVVDQDCAEETASACGFVTFHVSVVLVVERSGGHYRHSEHLREAQRHDET